MTQLVSILSVYHDTTCRVNRINILITRFIDANTLELTVLIPTPNT